MTQGPAKTSVLSRLMAVIEDRKQHPRADSYTCQLLSGGPSASAAKVREETKELIEAVSAQGDNKANVIHEAADVLYHLLVLLAERDVTLKQVEDELARRFGASGLEEKASRDGGTE